MCDIVWNTTMSKKWWLYGMESRNGNVVDLMNEHNQYLADIETEYTSYH